MPNKLRFLLTNYTRTRSNINMYLWNVFDAPQFYSNNMCDFLLPLYKWYLLLPTIVWKRSRKICYFYPAPIYTSTKLHYVYHVYATNYNHWAVLFLILHPVTPTYFVLVLFMSIRNPNPTYSGKTLIKGYVLFCMKKILQINFTIFMSEWTVRGSGLYLWYSTPASPFLQTV